MKNQGLFIAVASALVLLLLIYVFSGKKNDYDWTPKIEDNAYEPYDVGYFKDVLEKTYKEDFEYIKTSKHLEYVIDSGVGTMLYLNSEIELSKDHVHSLLKFVERGNNAFFSSDIYPEKLISEFGNVFLDVETYGYRMFKEQHVENADLNSVYTYNLVLDEFIPLFLEDSVAKLNFNFEKKTFEFPFYHEDSVGIRNWLGIPKKQFEMYNSTEKRLIPHSTINDSIVDFFSIKHGKGELFVHLNPMLLGNIFFIEQDGFDYAQLLTSNFSDGKLFYNKKHFYFNNNSSNPEAASDSALGFILKHKPLRWALYAILALTILYVLFGLKRKHQIIRHFQHPKNSSIRFVKALSSFYKSSGNYGSLSEEMIWNFEHFVRKRYRIKTDLPKKELAPLIGKLSGIPESEIVQIYDLNLKVEYGTDGLKSRAIKLHQFLENFYKNCK